MTTTYLNAREKAKAANMSITKNYFQGWFARKVGNRTQPTGQKSFVGRYPSYELQIDLFFINGLRPQKFKNGMACIDVFSNYATVVPTKSKT